MFAFTVRQSKLHTSELSYRLYIFPRLDLKRPLVKALNGPRSSADVHRLCLHDIKKKAFCVRERGCETSLFVWVTPAGLDGSTWRVRSPRPDGTPGSTGPQRTVSARTSGTSSGDKLWGCEACVNVVADPPASE